MQPFSLGEWSSRSRRIMFDIRPAHRPHRPYREKDRETAEGGRSLVRSLMRAGAPSRRNFHPDAVFLARHAPLFPRRPRPRDVALNGRRALSRKRSFDGRPTGAERPLHDQGVLPPHRPPQRGILRTGVATPGIGRRHRPEAIQRRALRFRPETPTSTYTAATSRLLASAEVRTALSWISGC